MNVKKIASKKRYDAEFENNIEYGVLDLNGNRYQPDNKPSLSILPTPSEKELAIKNF